MFENDAAHVLWISSKRRAMNVDFSLDRQQPLGIAELFLALCPPLLSGT